MCAGQGVQNPFAFRQQFALAALFADSGGRRVRAGILRPVAATTLGLRDEDRDSSQSAIVSWRQERDPRETGVRIFAETDDLSLIHI